MKATASIFLSGVLTALAASGAETVTVDFSRETGAVKELHGVNAGALLAWMEGATDLDGNPRLGRKSDQVPDIGCYEGVFNGLTLFVR